MISYRDQRDQAEKRVKELEGFIRAARTAFNTHDELGLKVALYACKVK